MKTSPKNKQTYKQDDLVHISSEQLKLYLSVWIQKAIKVLGKRSEQSSCVTETSRLQARSMDSREKRAWQSYWASIIQELYMKEHSETEKQ